MLCRDVMRVIEGAYPRSCAMDWDNVGLLTGSEEKEVKRVYLALDAVDEVIEGAVNARADLLVTHHPMIFSPMNRITEDHFIGRRVIRLIREDIAYYAMHTNYDVIRMAEKAAEVMGMEKSRVLEVTCPEAESGGIPVGLGRIGMLPESASLAECCARVKEKFFLDKIKVFGNPGRDVRCAAIVPGSGKSMVQTAVRAGADVLITGDIDHHTGIDAAAQGLAVIDGGHYGIERIFVRDMAEFLSRKCPEIEVVEAPVCHPFQIV